MKSVLNDAINFSTKLSARRISNAWLNYRSFHKSLKTKSTIHPGLPVSISLEPTTSCNLRCPECPSGLRSFTRPTGMMTKETYELIMASELTVNDFKKHNFIFLGQFKNIGPLQLFLDVVPLKIAPIVDGDREFSIMGQNGDTLRTFKSENLWDENAYNSDYGMIAKLPGYNDEQMVFICGFGYFSKIDLGKMLSTKKGLREIDNLLLNELGTIPPYFVMIFQMYGKSYTGYTSELQFVKEIDAAHYKKSIYELLSHE